MKIFGTNIVKDKLFGGDERNSLLKKNVVVSFLNKGFSVLISFLLVSVTINYVNAEQYGIWITIYSLITWITLFDFGMTHGFRNRFAESIGNNERNLCVKYVSTTFALLSIIFITAMVILLIANNFISWSNVLNLSPQIEDILKKMFFVIIICFCLKNILRVTTTLFTADQRPAIGAVLTTIESLLVLIAIWFLTLTTSGNLFYLAMASSGIPLLLIVLVTIVTFNYSKRYKVFRPHLTSVDFSLTKKILVLGGKFFIIQLCMLGIFQTVNIIILRYLGPNDVTVYNVIQKYYSLFYSLFIIVLTPFWSATTDAYVRGDLLWIKNSMKKLLSLFALCILGQVILFIISPWLMKIWLNQTVEVPWPISIAMAINILLLCYSSIFMYIINGFGKVTLQMYIYIFFFIVSIPLMIIGCKLIGLMSVILVTGSVYLVLALFGHIQVNKLLNNKAKGIWNK